MEVGGWRGGCGVVTAMGAVVINGSGREDGDGGGMIAVVGMTGQ